MIKSVLEVFINSLRMIYTILVAKSEVQQKFRILPDGKISEKKTIWKILKTLILRNNNFKNLNILKKNSIINRRNISIFY